MISISCSSGRMWVFRLLKLAIGISALLVIVLTVFAMAPHSRAMETVAINIAIVVRHVTQFAVGVCDRDRRCSIADAWTATGVGELRHIQERIENASKVIRIDGHLSLVATPMGLFWIPASDFKALAKELSEQQLKVYENSLRPGDVVLDCGANVGVYTRSALAKGVKLVVAIELAPETFVCLRRNFAHDIQDGRVIVYPKGVWDKDTTLRLTTNVSLTSADNSVALNRGALGPDVPLTTIDKLVAELKLPRVDFIKMDIEGAEVPALNGAVRTITAYKPRMAISMEHKRSDPNEIPALVQRLNPEYNLRCGTCGSTTGRVQPEVLLSW